MKRFELIIVVLFINIGYSQDYKALNSQYLNNAIEALENGNNKKYLSSLKLYSAAISQKTVTPDNIPDKDFELYTKCINYGFTTFPQIEGADKILRDGLKFMEVKATDYQDTNAMHGLFFIHIHGYGYEGIEINKNKAHKWNLMAANHGHLEAMWVLGNRYHYGDNDVGILEKNESKTIFWWNKAAEKGFTNAMNSLAVIYGEKKQFDKAFFWYKKGADLGDDSCMDGLAQLYFMGYGVEQDYEKAFDWCQKSAYRNNYQAMFYLASFYTQGLIVEKDNNKAFKWLEASAKGGYPQSMAYLGYMYKNGLGTAVDMQQAKKWYDKACEAGFKETCGKL